MQKFHLVTNKGSKYRLFFGTEAEAIRSAITLRCNVDVVDSDGVIVEEIAARKGYLYPDDNQC